MQATGIAILDPRAKVQDRRVSSSVFTQKFKADGDRYPAIIDMPTFGQSDNHAGVQVADILCSAILSPIAAYSYCSGHVNNVHVDPGFSLLKARYGTFLQQLQYRYQDDDGRWRGGIVVSDSISQKSGSHLFQ